METLYCNTCGIEVNGAHNALRGPNTHDVEIVVIMDDVDWKE